MITQLTEILLYYKDTYTVLEPIDDILYELLANGVEVKGDSFFCPIYNDELKATMLIAGTKDKADMWVLKKIIKLIKSGTPVYTMFNGNSDYLLKIAKRYDVSLISRDGDISYIAFNIKER